MFIFTLQVPKMMGLIDPSHLALIGQAVSEENMFENG